MVDFLLYVFDGDVIQMTFGIFGILMVAALLTERWWVGWAVGKLVEFKEKMKIRKNK